MSCNCDESCWACQSSARRTRNDCQYQRVRSRTHDAQSSATRPSSGLHRGVNLSRTIILFGLCEKTSAMPCLFLRSARQLTVFNKKRKGDAMRLSSHLKSVWKPRQHVSCGSTSLWKSPTNLQVQSLHAIGSCPTPADDPRLFPGTGHRISQSPRDPRQGAENSIGNIDSLHWHPLHLDKDAEMV